MPEIHFLVVQPTPFCNIDCKYCYLPDRANKARMSMQTLERVFAGVFQSGWCAPTLRVFWHSGEPMVVGADYFAEALETVARLTPDGIAVRHGLNTNATLVDDAWCEVLKAQDVHVGVSIDGPKDIHDAYRVTRNGKGTFDATIAGLRKIREAGVRLYALSVLTDRSLGAAARIFDFFVAEKVRLVGFNVEEIEGANRDSTMVGEDRKEALDAFLRELWALLVEAGHPFAVREFEGMIRNITLQPGEQASQSLNQPYFHVSVDVHGNFATFSPELLGLKDARYDDFIIGNFAAGSLAESQNSPALRRQLDDISAGVDLCRQSCDYFPVCGGGAPVNKLGENGAFASAKTMSCTLTKQVMADVMLDVIDAAAERPDFEEALDL